MPAANVSLVIPEADVADAKAAAEAFTGLTKTEAFTPSAKELLAAVTNQLIDRYRHQQAVVPKSAVA